MVTTEYSVHGETGDEILSRLTVDWLLAHLDAEEREILTLWIVNELTFDEIGVIIGTKYRGRELTGSAIRYHKDRIIERLREFREAAGE